MSSDRADPPSGSVRIEGVRPLLEALRAGRRRIWRAELPEGGRSPGLRELRESLRAHRVPCTSAAEVGAWAEPFPEEPFEQLLLRDPVQFLVLLDRVTDVGNLGSIARSAETAGCDGLVLELRHAPPVREGALRASAGALEALRVGRTPNLRRAVELLRAEGFTVLAAAPGGVELGALGSELCSPRLAWVFGSEDRGVRPSLLAAADRIVGIPTHGRIDSLGVAAAAAFLLHRSAELRRSGRGGGPGESAGGVVPRM